MLNPLHNQFDGEALWQADHDHFVHPWTHFELVPQGRFAGHRQGRGLLCDRCRRAALSRRHRRHVVRQCRLRAQGTGAGHGAAGRGTGLFQHVRRRHQPARGDVGGQACRAGAGQPVARDVRPVGIGGERGGGAAGALLSWAQGQLFAPPHHLAQQLLSRLDLPHRLHRQARGRHAAGVPVSHRHHPSSLGALSLSPAGGHGARCLHRFPGGRVQGQDRRSGGGEHRLLHRRADPGIGRRGGAAAGLSQAHARRVQAARHPVHRRRGGLGLRAHRSLVCLRGRVRHRRRTSSPAPRASPRVTSPWAPPSIRRTSTR